MNKIKTYQVAGIELQLPQDILFPLKRDLKKWIISSYLRCDKKYWGLSIIDRSACVDGFIKKIDAQFPGSKNKN